MIAGWCSHEHCNSPAHAEVNGKFYCYTHAAKATEVRPRTLLESEVEEARRPRRGPCSGKPKP